MRQWMVWAAVAASASIAGAAWAQNAQQQLMSTCNAQAKAENKKGEERKAFMKSCLSDGRKAQQEKMKICNLHAKGKKGAERKVFMKECLRSK